MRHGSLRVACEVMRQASQTQRHVLVYVHGYNNDMSDVVKTVEEIEALYFTGNPVERNAELKTLFSLALEGGRAEEGLRYEVDINAYRLP